MERLSFYDYLIKKLRHTPTESQREAIRGLVLFLTKKEYKDSIFVLRGYAGTGKTTIISALVKSLMKTPLKTVLLAPTGRAAKVMSSYSKMRAYTIHKYIYKSNDGDFGVNFWLKNNKDENTVYIVDEASMINFDTNGDSLLGDFVRYAYNGAKCRIIFVGDSAQLPPIGAILSPALESDFLHKYFEKEVLVAELRDTVRQKKESGILKNATKIRNCIVKNELDFKFDINNIEDVKIIGMGADLKEAIEDSYRVYGIEQTNIVVRSNNRSNKYNELIKKEVFDQEELISVGDLLMVVRNNYFWLDEKAEAGFIANGDIIEVTEIYDWEEKYGFRFMQIKARMIDYPSQEEFETTIILDVLYSESSSLTWEQNSGLYNSILTEMIQKGGQYSKYKDVKNSPYLNALQVKYSYCVTCHKSQGGQWDVVFVEKPYLPDGASVEYLRWLYTAVTRAKKKLYLIGFDEEDFE